MGTTAAAGAGTTLTKDRLAEAYRVMRTIRAFEERLHVEYRTGEIPGAVHLYAGQEAIAAGVCAHLGTTDYVGSTHRGHGHAIAKGSDTTAMMLEVYGRAGGLCGGKGGSMHIADPQRGLLGANGIAAGGVPMVCGAGLSARLRGTGQVAVAFLGDGAANQGAFLESLNLAAVWQLPVVFVVEDNGYAQATGTAYHLRGIEVAERARAFGIPARTVDGTDYFAVHDAAAEAVGRARTGGGPTLLEARAMRFFGHMEGWDEQGYRAEDEVDRLRRTQDCLTRFTDRVRTEDLLPAAELARIDEAVLAEIDAAVAAARAAEPPAASELTTDVYTV
ncbi:thiamine pyrophosphate-dependent dehydrogenase E1 component subunit alpha [Kitasatospora viridis]|uniref:Pyruvate dehydrogenase E1 component alpha subunit n=1 Tax=Kitasatospora viridis TaxID=281105 RepID=A0A561UCG5_9ACTN|nr:thiamine pyrophosphate-dependent dehydrogenase E1 component subunit alpha [Kitasatospora viridis]TWF97055.1 pyruvate dehydrogenase E1 component alpha subunit [Kitasatospora viridis]